MGRIYKRDDKYGLDFADHKGKRIRRLVSTDKGVALRMLADALETVERRRAGVLLADPRETKRPIQEHIDAYLDEMERRGRDPMYRYIIQKRLEAAAFAQEWGSLRECDAASVADYLNGLAGDGKSPRTVNQHRADLSAFFAWCARQGVMESNPCDHVPKTTTKLEKKRRALSVAECRRLLAAAPPERALVYRVLLCTGLRRGEASEIRWAHVHLDVANPYIELPAPITKSGKAELVPLIGEAAEALCRHRDGARDKDRVFDAIPSMELFRTDLAAAGIEEEDARGRRVVVHSLRHSLATMLAQSQVPPAIAMKIMRHRDIRLTLEAYTDEGLLPIAAAMSSLPSLTAAG